MLQVSPVIGKCLWKKFVFHMHKRNKNGVSMIDVIETLSANIHKGKVYGIRFVVVTRTCYWL